MSVDLELDEAVFSGPLVPWAPHATLYGAGRRLREARAAARHEVEHTVVCQEIARTALELGGPEALVHGSRVELLWRQSLWETIGGGTSEVMRGAVARQGLGIR